MDTQENHRNEKIQKICLYAAPLLAVVIHYFLEGDALSTLYSNGIFMVLLSSGYLLFIRTSGGKVFQRIEHDVLFWGCFTLSFLLLGMHSIKGVGVLWMLVVAFAAMEVGMDLSVSLHILLLLAYVIVVLLPGGDLYAFAVKIFFGFVVATLFSLYRSREATIYLAIILLAVDGVLQLVLYRLNFHVLASHGLQIGAEMAGILILVFLGRGFLQYIPGIRKNEGSARKSYLEQLTEEEFPLVQTMRSHSVELYQHSRRIADLSEQAANTIGADGILARAGGLYHEIGRITGEENYIEAGVVLGEEYSFPEDLKALIRQHSPNYELPDSPEAAVVMLSDCILSTSEYLERRGLRDKMPEEQLVHSVFQNRLSRGNLKECGMSVEQLEDLQTFFVGHAFDRGDRNDRFV